MKKLAAPYTFNGKKPIENLNGNRIDVSRASLYIYDDKPTEVKTSILNGYAPVSVTDFSFCAPKPISYSLFMTSGIFFRYKRGFKVNNPCIIGSTSRLVKDVV